MDINAHWDGHQMYNQDNTMCTVTHPTLNFLQYGKLRHTQLTRNLLQWCSISSSSSFGITLNKNNNHTITIYTLPIPYSRKLSGCKISLKWCTCFRIIFTVLIAALAACTQQLLTTHTALCVMPFFPSVCQEILRNIDWCANLLPAWHFFCQERSYPCRVGSLSTSPQQKKKNKADLFCLLFVRCVNCPFYSRTTRKQRSTKVCSTVFWQRATFKLKGSLVEIFIVFISH